MPLRTDLPHPLSRQDAAVQSAGVGVWLNPLPLGELVWNDNTKAHFHLPPDARPSIDLFFERLHDDDRERVRQSVARAVEEGRPFDEVYRTVSPTGALKWIHAVGRTVYGEDGTPVQFDGITLDISAAISAQQMLRDFADSAPAILWVTEASGLCTFLSRGWTAFTGQSEAAGLGHGWLEMVHPEDRPETEAVFLRAIAERREFALEHRIRRANGAWAWVIDAGRPSVSSEGVFRGFSGSVTDIDERRRAEDALRRSSQRYARLLESIDQGFCVVQILLDADGRPHDYRFLETNQVFERQTGLQAPVGRTARELVPQLEAFWFQAYGEVALMRRPQRFTHGSEAMGRWFDVFASPIGEPDELQVAILFQDISQRITQEHRLRDSEERYRGFLASSTEGIWRMEFQPPVDLALPEDAQMEAVFAHGRFAECNEVFAHMLDMRSPAEVVGQRLARVFDADLAATQSFLQRWVWAGYRSTGIESVELGEGRGDAWYAYILSGVVENGHLVRAWGTQRDIGARKRAEAALREADRRKDEFLATLAHELRNPLASIRSAAELLGRGEAASRGVAPAEVIGRQASYLARMIDDLMDVSRVTRGRLELRLAPVALGEVLRLSVDGARAVLEAGHHVVELRVPSLPVWVRGDEVRLVQVMLNLLGNAARYSDDGQPIAVTLETDDTTATIRVRDLGIGIAAQDLDRVFDLFFQGPVDPERTGGGLGIGLALVRQLCELHGGTVEAQSAGPGRGSEFVLRLPVAAAPVAPQPADTAARPSDGAPEPEGRRVLVVDDNRDAADTLAEVLRMMGCTVYVAYDGLQGLAVAEAERPEVVVMDLGMPKLDGYGACRALRDTDWGRRMTVIALSGWGPSPEHDRSAQAGFDGHLVKPVEPQALFEAITRPGSPQAG